MDDSNSMYLSFDAESTTASAAYKTLCDFSVDRNMDLEEENENNSTLEAPENMVDTKNYLKTIKKFDAATSPFPRLFNNMLQDNLCSSTPTKAQLMRSVAVTRGSEEEQCGDLKMVICSVVDGKKCNLSPGTSVENKENAHPQSADGSTLSRSSNNDASPKYMLKLKSPQKDNKNQLENDANSLGNTEQTLRINTGVQEKPEQKQIIDEGATTTKSVKRNIPKKTRASICEPNLQHNRPSRILVNNNKYNPKRYTVTTTDRPIDNNVLAELPKLFDKTLKITEKKVEATTVVEVGPAAVQGKHMQNGSKARGSLLPTIQFEKRPYSYTQRMSILVKTTLNSPARKTARNGEKNMPTSRRSMMPTKIQPPTSKRKSMLPVVKSTIITAVTHGGGALTSLIEDGTGYEAKSLKANEGDAPIKKTTASIKTKDSSAPLKNAALSLISKPKIKISKPETTYDCSDCGSKFRIKSLLVAHKLSHDDGMPGLVKKLSVSDVANAPSTSSTYNTNQCKYCDKKFAILRTLHIHLLQNCPKIPPKEKRKLNFTEMNHVEKAQLPNFSQGNPKPNWKSAAASALNMPKTLQPSLTNASASSTESLVDKKEITVIDVYNTTKTVMGPPTSVSKLKKPNIAHSGVFRTPNKTVPCHVCKQSFMNILDYTKHCMTMHSGNNTPGGI